MIALLSLILLISSCNSEQVSERNIIKSDVIYGDDDRVLLTESSPLVQSLGSSIASMVFQGRIRPAPRDPGFYKVGQTPASIAYDVCQQEQFSNQSVLGSCSGFLIDEQTLITAGHCVSDQLTCDNITWVFNRKSDDALIPENQVYTCESIIETGITNSQNYLDYTVLKLDRKVEKAQPLAIELSKNVAQEDQVFAIGHPFGVPLVMADNAIVTSEKSTYEKISIFNNQVHGEDKEVFINPYAYFMADLDVFIGNSGSPVFNKDNIVIGIVASGADDWILNDDFCNESNIIKNYDEKTELILNIQSVPYLNLSK